MRVRFAGSVIIVNNKGIVTLTVSLLCLFILLLFFQTLFLKENDDVVETNVLSIDKVLQEKNLLKSQQTDKINKDSIGEKGSKLKIDFQKENFKSLKEHAGDFINNEENQELNDDNFMNEKSFAKIREKNEKKILVEEKNYKKYPNENEFSGKIQMAMDVIPIKTRKIMEVAAKSMHLPHRPPDVHYNINVTLSDLTSLDREIPDTRPPVCASIIYDLSIFPKVSIIIPFFNEAPTMLLRNIHSILNRTPNQLLEEIILGMFCRFFETSPTFD